MRSVHPFVLWAALALACAPAAADVMTLQQNLDGYVGVEDVYCDGWDTTYYPPWRNHGGEDKLRFYQPLSTNRRKILIRFNELGSAIPAGSGMVLSATLHLYHYTCEYPTDPETDNVAVYRVLKDWQEGDNTGAYVPQTGMSCRYRHEPNHTPASGDWTQNATYDKVWELTVSETVNQCLYDEAAGGNQWSQVGSVEEVHNTANSWYQDGSTLYVNKGDDNAANPSDSGSYPYSAGFAYHYASDMWEGEAATGPTDIDQANPVLASWDDLSDAYDPDNPGSYEGPTSGEELHWRHCLHREQRSQRGCSSSSHRPVGAVLDPSPV